ncbi:MAG TPA: isoleucine--tRNA ligase [Candidatus Faecisoma merdavium]|nr:isoleucine--tRNA ligase [Candidatus Faecisoma merdavium]
MEFKELNKKTINESETEVLSFWKENNIFEKSIENRKDKKNYVFYDGPIYANAKPGIHHVFAKTIKDSFTKYKTMQGYRVLRKIGLDTHGLPIEVNVEKKLGFKNKSDIEKFGIENFCHECNCETATNISEVKKITDMMGQFIDCDNPYVTCDNEYIESEWWIVKEMDKKGLIYYGNKVLPYCPRCGTELSSNEVAQGYQQDSVNTVIVPFKKKDEDVYFLVWTTTPWTLMANVAICVNPDLTYLKIESQGYKFILCESLADKVLGEDYKILEKYKGSDLQGIKYEQLLPFVKVEGKAFEVVADSYVTDSDGTGIVHIAPAYGEDDNRVCREKGISFVNPVGKDGCYLEGPWKGRLVTDTDLEIEIVKYLKENDKLFKKIKIVHDYPHCWRCKSPLIYYAKPAWYVKTTAYKDKIIEANKKVNWYPDYIGEKRFANWLENMVDWGISRNRYWGCPMPIWTCECGHKEVIGSLDELQEKIIEDVDVKKIELHRPYVDELHIKCSKCGKVMDRVKDVMDVWFDSGSMPYAQFHYPFENKELFESQFPADFIAEGVDQTRGWFYVLLVISTIISGESSFKNVVVNDMMLDAYGKKMSKSTGNIIDPSDIMTKYGADTVRYYMLYASPVWTPLKFDETGLKEIYSKYISTFKNAYSFFEMYANADHIDPRVYHIEESKRELIDRWLLSKLNRLIKNVTMAYEEYDLNKVARLIVPFLNDDLSNWYIRSNRRRFWDSQLSESKKAVYLTTYEVLVTLCKLCAPITPFLTEEIYQKLTGEESVHLADFPKYDEKLIDFKIEEQMDLVRDVCSLGRFAREEANIKVRQPISHLILPLNDKDIIGDLISVIEEELNVKEIIFKEDMSEYLDYIVKPNFKVLGKTLGPKVKELQEILTKLSTKDIALLQSDGLTVKLGDEDFKLTNEMVLISLKQKEGYASSSNNKTCVVLNTELTEDLILEGLAREFVRKVQSLRKEADFVITDHIKVIYHGSDKINQMLDKYYDYVMGEVLGDELIKDETLAFDDKLNDEDVVIKVEKK